MGIAFPARCGIMSVWTIALHFMHHNFCPIHQTPRATPAIEAGISDHVWPIEEIVELLDAAKVRNAAA